jgi:predicted PurR-regulated permease PerM
MDPMIDPNHHTGELKQISFLLILATVTCMAVFIVWPFATTLLWSVLAAIMFQPLYRWCLKKCRGRRNPAALLALVFILLAVILPALWIGTLVIGQALQLVEPDPRQSDRSRRLGRYALYIDARASAASLR